METIACPHCQNLLKPYDRRDRKATGTEGETTVYRLRRLRCQRCLKLHLELPDLLLPYKRYESSVVEAVIAGGEVQVPVDERTLGKIRRWYRKIKTNLHGVWNWCVLHGFASPKQQLKLVDLVRTAVNSGFWVFHPNGRYQSQLNPL